MWRESGDVFSPEARDHFGDALHYAVRRVGQMTVEIGDWVGLSTRIGFPKT